MNGSNVDAKTINSSQNNGNIISNKLIKRSTNSSIKRSGYNIRTDHIDNLDNINRSGSLNGITFYQNNSSKIEIERNKEKEFELSLLETSDEDQDNQEPSVEPEPTAKRSDKEIHSDRLTDGRNNMIVGSIIINEEKLFDDQIKKTNIISNSQIMGSQIMGSQITGSQITGSQIKGSQITSSRNQMIEETDNTKLLEYSHYFALECGQEEFELNITDLIKEIIIVLLLHLFFGIHGAIFNIITIDGLITGGIFFMSSWGVDDQNNFLLKNRLMTIDRYIYYFLLFCGYYIFNHITWYSMTNVATYVASIMICPSIMGQIYSITTYRKIRKVLYEGYNKLIQKIVCKQLCKIINLIIKNVLNLPSKIKYDDLIPFYDQFSWVVINKFIVTFILACIFNHIDKGGMKFPMMIYKNLYLKDNRYNITDDREYLKTIIKDKQWSKFMDVYTLNRIIRMLVTDDAQNSILSDQVTVFLKKLAFKINRIMFCWTIMSISNLTLGILCFLLFILNSKRPTRYIINTLVFAVLSTMTVERLLVIIMCELFYPIVESKLLGEIFTDTYRSIKRGIANIYYGTRLESIALAVILPLISLSGHQRIGILIVCYVNLIIIYRFLLLDNSDTDNVNRLSSFVRKYSLYRIPKKQENEIAHVDRKMDIDIEELEYVVHFDIPVDRMSKKNEDSDVDMLIVIRDKLKELFNTNLMLRLINPFAMIENIERGSVVILFLNMFGLLLFGSMSNFTPPHIILLPIILQNIFDFIM
jgi:hypothetical protein